MTVRTLLVDNYDSFTYNLFHYLAEVNGQEPEVVPNDSPLWRPGHLGAFDNVVLSPGPGHPGRQADFGICGDIVARTALPVLGVCLGHQGIGLWHGARVGRAPRPVHGFTSPVLHSGTELFAGLPQGFEAVRYHSLAVDALPAQLEATAGTRDGVLMGLRHRYRPQWGVQFHPESIGGHDGHRLLANFRALTERRSTTRNRPVPVSPARPCTTGGGTRRELTLCTREIALTCDAESAYDTLFRSSRHAYWLDSSRPNEDTGRFSIMGDAAGPQGRTVSADAWNGTLTVTDSAGRDAVLHQSLLSWLDRDLRDTVLARVPEGAPPPCDFSLGWVGYLGYELKAECGGDRAHRSELPDAVLAFSDRALVLDHRTGRAWLMTLGGSDWLDQAERRLAAAPPCCPAPQPAAPEAEAEAEGGLTLRHDRETYLGLIDACQQETAQGESYEICLTNMASSDRRIDVWEGYRRLRRCSPAPYGALLSLAGVSVLSTSFERFLTIDRDGVLDSRPVKGTRPRGATPAQDADLVADLLTNPKDRAENLMIVDLVRNDLGRCAEVGSVRAEDVFRVESYATVHQLVSTVTARRRAEVSPMECVRAAFPPGSMTGAPKLRTMQIIDRLEQGPRGVYAGAIGYFSLDGSVDLSVVIRTAVVTADGVRYGVGGAILAGSDPHAEFEETAVKAAPLTMLTGLSFPRHAATRA